MQSISVKAPAKLNLFLLVLNKRPDGYHSINTLFERIDLCDNITITRRSDSNILVSSRSSQVAKGRANLAYKSAQALRKRFSIKEGINIYIEKNIPIGAGLGGGSSDAAATILALNRMWKLKLGKFELTKIAGQIGSDVPFFIQDSRFCFAKGRGERLEQLKVGIKLWHILVVPKVCLSTKRVYDRFDSLQKAESKGGSPKISSLRAALTKQAKDVNMFTPLDKKSKSYLTGFTPPEKGAPVFTRGRKIDNSLKGLLIFLANNQERLRRLSLFVRTNYNSLEPAAGYFTPQIGKIKRILYSLGIEAAGMSGSGPSVFGILNSRKEGEYLRRRLAKFKNWRTFVVRTF